MNVLEEIDLINGLKQQKEEAFIELVNLFKKKVINLCYSYTEDRDEAEDLSQEVFLSLYNSIRNFRGDSLLSTYIYKITLSKCIDYKRKRKIISLLTGFPQARKEISIDVDDKLYVRQIINGLNKDMKIVIILHYYIGLNYREISEVLNTSTKAVEGKIYRAKQKMRKEFEKEGYRICSKNGIL